MVTNKSADGRKNPDVPAAADAETSDQRTNAALLEIGLTRSEFDHFVEKFVGHRFDYAQKGSADDSTWFLATGRYLTDSRLIKHLKGELFIATGCRWEAGRHEFRTSYFVIDLDYADDPFDLRVRYEKVVAALGLPNQLFTSSQSGGVHLYYHLTNEVSLHSLRSRDGRRGVVIDLLAQGALKERLGQLEVYPRGQYRLEGIQRRVRLPFGAGSRLFDPETLEPVTGRSLRENLQASRRMFEDV